MSKGDELLNRTSEATNKLLAALNSGAYVAFLHFYANIIEKGIVIDFGCISPAVAFALGLTCILFSYAFNYFNGAFFWIKDKNSNVMSTIATCTALVSAICFVLGIWSIALAI